MTTRLVDALQTAPAAGPVTCSLAHRLTPDAVTIEAEITMMFSEIFQWLPDLEITSEPARLLSPFINGIKRMDCRFTPAAVPVD